MASQHIAFPPVVAECHGIAIPQDPMITPETIAQINAATYRADEITAVLAAVRDGDSVLQIGAGFGILGAIAARVCGAAAVLTIDADPARRAYVDTLYRLNEIAHFAQITDRSTAAVSGPMAPLPHRLIAGIPEMRPDVLLLDMAGGELAFLRAADLSAVRRIVIIFSPEAYGMNGVRTCKGLLRQAGFGKIGTASTRTVWACARNMSLPAPSPLGGWSGQIETLHRAVIVPPPVADFVQQAGVLDADGRHCAKAALWRNGRALTVAPETPLGPIAERAGTWLWGGVLWMHFGHFLVESTARLWALDQLTDRIEGILFIPKRPRHGSEVADFQRDFTALMGTDARLVCLDAPTRIERLIVPGQGFGLGTMIGGTDGYRSAIARSFATGVAAAGPEDLYISRSLLPAGRGNLIGETALEAGLAAQGYTVYHPQQHDLTSQIATYKAARRIVAAEGSALHLLAMVARPDQKVAIVVRRPSAATQQLAKHLHAFAGIRAATLCRLTRSWKPEGNARSRLWMGELDLPALQSDLERAGFIAPHPVRWAPLDPVEVERKLNGKFEVVEASGQNPFGKTGET